MTRPEEVEAALRLRLAPGVGDRRTARLLRRWGSAAESLRHPGWIREELGETAARNLLDPDMRREAERVWRACRKKGIGVVAWGEAGYPDRVRELFDPPPVLFHRGSLDQLGKRSVAVVGSRRATAGGRRVAGRLGRELSGAGVLVLSGLALGVDGAAHRGALEAGGPGGTAAVLGTGVDRPYPRLHRRLFQEIAHQGCLISEFPPGTDPRPHHFPRRNRILAALADAVVVVEAAPGSGALITAEHAQDLGRTILCVPGSVETEQSRGTNGLIREGAGLVTGARDVLDHLRWGLPAPDPAFQSGASEGGTPCERRILGLLGRVPLSLEGILEGTGLPPSRVLATLTEMEVGGRARRLPEGWVEGEG